MHGPRDMECDGQNFLPFWTVFCPFTPCVINNNHMMYSSWNTERNGQNFLSIWTIFCPFTPLTTRKIKLLKKWKKQLKILSFSKCVPYRQNFLTFCTIFCTFTPLTNQKIKMLKKPKIHLEISPFYICVPQIIIRRYMVPEIWCGMDRWKRWHRGGCPT